MKVTQERRHQAVATTLLVLLALAELLGLVGLTVLSRFYDRVDFWARMTEWSEPWRSLSFALLFGAIPVPLVALSRGNGRKLMLALAARLCGPGPNMMRRLVAFALAGFFGLCAVLYYGGSHVLMAVVAASHPPVIVVGYAEPWQSLTFVVAFALLTIPMLHLGAGQARLTAGRVGVALVTLAAGVWLVIELGTYVIYDQHNGTLHVSGAVPRRGSVDFPISEDGACVRVSFDSHYRWAVNGKQVYVSLLPVARATESLKAALARHLPENC